MAGGVQLPSFPSVLLLLPGKAGRQARPTLLFSVSDERGESGQGQDGAEHSGLAGKQPGQCE